MDTRSSQMLLESSFDQVKTRIWRFSNPCARCRAWVNEVCPLVLQEVLGIAMCSAVTFRHSGGGR